MKTKKVTLLLMLTVVSLLTIFLVILLDDTVLASEGLSCKMIPNLNLSQVSSPVIMGFSQVKLGVNFLPNGLRAKEVV